MDFKIHYKDSFSMLEVNIRRGETLITESGSMVAMDDGTEIKTTIGSWKGGVLARIIAFLYALVRKFLGGESFFINKYSTVDDTKKVFIAPKIPGSIVHIKLENQSLIVQGGSFLACSGGIRLKIKWMGFRSFFMGEGLFFLELSGNGDLWLNSYGTVEKIDLKNTLIVDTGHIVAFEPTISYAIRTVGGIKSTLFSGEGLVVQFDGNGTILIQSHNISGTVGWITPLLPE